MHTFERNYEHKYSYLWDIDDYDNVQKTVLWLAVIDSSVH